MKHLISFLLILSCLAQPAFAQPVRDVSDIPLLFNGNWLISWVGREEVVEQAALSLEQSRNTAIGRLTFGRDLMTPQIQEIKAHLEGDQLRFEVYRQRGDWHMKTYSGTLQPDGTIVGSMDPPAEGGEQWTAVPHNNRISLRVLDLENAILEVTHQLEYGRQSTRILEDEAGDRYAVLNNKGYAFATGPVQIHSVTNRETGEPIRYQLVPSVGFTGEAPNELLRVYLPESYQQGDLLQVDIIASAEARDDIKQVENGEWVFTFKSGFRGQFELPSGHSLVESSQPGYFTERDGYLVWNMDYLDRRMDFEIRTRTMSDILAQPGV